MHLLDQGDYSMITAFKQTYLDVLKQYYFVGGMPEAVQSFIDEKNFNEVRNIQKRILTAYEQDFSKHAPSELVPRIRMVLYVKEAEQRSLKPQLCGFVIAD